MDNETLLLKLDLQFFAKDGPGGEKSQPQAKNLMTSERKVRLLKVKR